MDIRFIKDGDFYLLEYKRKRFFKTKWVLFGKYHGSVGGDAWIVESSRAEDELLNNFLRYKKIRRDCISIRQHPTIKII